MYPIAPLGSATLSDNDLNRYLKRQRTAFLRAQRSHSRWFQRNASCMASGDTRLKTRFRDVIPVIVARETRRRIASHLILVWNRLEKHTTNFENMNTLFSYHKFVTCILSSCF